MGSVLRSHWWLIFFVLFYPLLIIYGYSDFIRESELNARLGWWLLLGGLAYFAFLLSVKRIFWFVLAVFVFSGVFDIAYAVTFGGVFTSASFEAIALTDFHEGGEFLIAYTSWENVTYLLLYVAVVVYSVRQIQLGAGFDGRVRKGFALIGILFLVAAVVNIHERGRFFDTVPGFLGVAIDYAKGREGIEKSVKDRQNLYLSSDFRASLLSNEPQTYVIVIGESMGRNHMSLYGYARKTTPTLELLNQKGELVVFNDVVSAYAQTRPSLDVILTQSDTINKMPESEAVSLVGVFKRAGFKTWWLSNQQPLRFPTSALAALADEFHFVSNDFKGVEVNRFDEYLLPYLTKALNDSAMHKIIFVHLMGSHLQYQNRYPAEKSVFKGADSINGYQPALSEKQIDFINAYDNSIIYTDELVGNMISMLKAQSGIAALSFFADHGEEVFDKKDFKGHGPDGVTHNMVEIPFILWRNETYKTFFGQENEHLEKQINTSMMMDDYFHFAICMAGVKSDLQIEQRNLCSINYQPKPRLIYGQDYDKGFK